MSEQDIERYYAACHAVQSGVLVDQDTGGKGDTPKHLRVGINVALCQQGAMVKLLVEKGILTQDEYDKAMADALEEEVTRYEKMLSERLGKKVTLI